MARRSEKRKRHTQSSRTLDTKRAKNWDDDETLSFIKLVKKEHIIPIMNARKLRNPDKFWESLEPKMRQRGYFRTAYQMRGKLKMLREFYYKWKQGKSCTFPFMDEVVDMLEDKKAKDTSKNRYEDESDFEDDIETDDSKSDTETQSKRRPAKRKMVQESEDPFTKQTEMLKTVLIESQELADENFRNEMATQRKWEEQQMELEHKYQMTQIKALMDGFYRGIQTIANSASNLEFSIPESIPSGSVRLNGVQNDPLKYNPMNNENMESE